MKPFYVRRRGREFAYPVRKDGDARWSQRDGPVTQADDFSKVKRFFGIEMESGHITKLEVSIKRSRRGKFLIWRSKWGTVLLNKVEKGAGGARRLRLLLLAVQAVHRV